MGEGRTYGNGTGQAVGDGRREKRRDVVGGAESRWRLDARAVFYVATCSLVAHAVLYVATHSRRHATRDRVAGRGGGVCALTAASLRGKARAVKPPATMIDVRRFGTDSSEAGLRRGTCG